MFNREIEKIIEDTCEERCEENCGDDEKCMEDCIDKCSCEIENYFDDNEITFFSDKADEIETLINKLWKMNEELNKVGLRKSQPAIDIEYYFTKTYNALYNLEESFENYVNHLVELKKKGEL